ncbi:MAG: hypothetical protein AAGN46_06565 [Acidobacteriota bacterium]
MLWLMLAVFFAGAFGGSVNALISDNGFVLPKAVMDDQSKIIRPGFLGNLLIGGVAAVISWGLYGELARYPILQADSLQSLEASSTGSLNLELSLATFVGAMLIGVGGARWLTNEVDKKLLRSAASQAAAGRADHTTAIKMLSAPPSQALQLALRGSTPPPE